MKTGKKVLAVTLILTGIIVASQDIAPLKNILNGGNLVQAAVAAPQETDFKVKFDGRNLNLTLRPLVKSDRTFYPFKELLEGLGYKVSWNDKTRTASAVKGGITLTLPLASNAMTSFVINGRTYGYNNGQPFIHTNNRTYIPVNDVCTALGFSVKWDASTSTILILSPVMKASSTSFSLDGKQLNVAKEFTLSDGSKTYINFSGLKQALPGYDSSDTSDSSIGIRFKWKGYILTYNKSTGILQSTLPSGGGTTLGRVAGSKNSDGVVFINFEDVLQALQCKYSVTSTSFSYQSPEATATAESYAKYLTDTQKQVAGTPKPSSEPSTGTSQPGSKPEPSFPVGTPAPITDQTKLKEFEKAVFEGSMKLYTVVQTIKMITLDVNKVDSSVKFIVNLNKDQNNVVRTAPLAAGDLYGVFLGDELKIMRIPLNAICVSDTGDMRYGWVNVDASKQLIDRVNEARRLNGTWTLAPYTLDTTLRNRQVPDSAFPERDSFMKNIFLSTAGLGIGVGEFKYSNVQFTPGFWDNSRETVICASYYSIDNVGIILRGWQTSDSNWEMMFSQEFNMADCIITIRPDGNVAASFIIGGPAKGVPGRYGS